MARVYGGFRVEGDAVGVNGCEIYIGSQGLRNR